LRFQPWFLDPDQNPVFEFWLGHSGQFFILKKNQNDIILIKKKINKLQLGFLPGFTGLHQVFLSFIFFSTQSSFSFGLTHRF
jgi:hypothetical protein